MRKIHKNYAIIYIDDEGDTLSTEEKESLVLDTFVEEVVSSLDVSEVHEIRKVLINMFFLGQVYPSTVKEENSSSSLTVEKFKEIMAGDVFAKGEVPNSPEGIYMTNNAKGKMLRWVAKKGFGNDWAIYCHWADKEWWWIEQSGDKVTSEANIRKLVPCTDEVFKLYRL